jgi:hypothetical protein
MGIVFRQEKGSPLSIEEMDGNFKDLHERVIFLENHPLQAEGIGKIEQEQDLLKITGTFGSNLGTFILPKVLPRLCGMWKEQTMYRQTDWVQKEKNLYVCTHSHQSENFSEDLKKDYWVLAYKGE